MKTKSILAACLFAATTLQAQTFEWAKSFGGSSNEAGYSITVDASGNVYTTGYFQGTVDFDPGVGTTNLTSAGGGDVFIQKLDASGNFVWAKSFGGSSGDEGVSITVDALGNVYTMGRFNGTADFDPGAGTVNLTSAGGPDIFVQKLDASGNFVWAKSFGGGSSDIANSIAVDALGNIYTTGYFEGTADFDPGADTTNLTSAGNLDVFIQKLDASGNFVWAKSFGGSSGDIVRSMTVDALGSVYTSGYFFGTVDFDPGAGIADLTSAGGSDVFVQKLDSSGNFVWAKSFGGSSGDIGHSITVDASGNVYTTGVFQETVDFDPGAGTTNLTSAGLTDVFVQKLDASGNFVWVKAFGGSSSDGGISITVDASGNVYTTGTFNGTVDFDPGAGTTNLTSAGGWDIFVLKLDASGDFVWAKSFGGSADDLPYSIIVDASGNIFTTGFFREKVDFDPGAGIADLTSSGGSDVFVHKMSPCTPNSGIDVITACDSYTWIDGNTYTASNNTATFTLTNALGCDSVVTLNLTIHSVSDITTSISGLTITANLAGATYQWLDCDNNYAVIGGETNQTFTATANGNYAAEITENGCVDTSACVAITSVGILENTFAHPILLFPNPTKGMFTVDLGIVYASTKITITDALGRMVSSSSHTSLSTIHITLDEPAGIYFIEISAGDKMAKLKLLKQ